MKKYINTLVFLFCAVATFAQAPQKFNYQAVARNAQGTMLSNQAVKIRASVLDGSANGTSQYSETHSVTTSQLGLFNLAIGAGTVVSGTFANVTWSTGDKYLKIEMDATGGNNFSLVGTSQLLSVPYALNAGNGSQWENNGQGIHYESGNVGIGTNNPLNDLHINGQMVLGNSNYAGGSFTGIPFTPFSDVNALWIGRYDDVPSNAISDYAVIYAEEDSVNTNIDKYILNIIVGDDFTTKDKVFIGNADHTTSSLSGLSVQYGNIGIGGKNLDVKARVHVSEGDVYIEDINRGVIMKSPNGQCWRMTVTNTGQPVFTNITCP